MAKIKRRKFKEVSKVIDISGIKVTAEVESEFGGEKVELTITGGGNIKHSELRKLRPLFGMSIREEVLGSIEDVLWDFVFKNFEIEGEEFEQTPWNLGYIIFAIWNEILKKMESNKKK